MDKLKKEFVKGFTVLNNEILRNNNISSKTKGIYAVLVSLPNEWNFSINGLKAILKENETAIANSLKELEEFGLLKREYFYNSKGFRKANYIISDTLFFYKENPSKENPIKENPIKENPIKENPSNNKIKKELNKEIIKERNNNDSKESLPKNNFLVGEKKYFENEKINNLFLEYLKTRNKSSNTKRAILMLLNKLKNYNEEEIEEALENAIIGKYKSVYPKKKAKTNINSYVDPNYNYKKDTNVSKKELEEIEELMKGK